MKNTTTTAGERWLSTRQVAEKLGIHYNTARNWILSGNLPAMRLSSTTRAQYRVKESDVDAYMDSLESAV